MRTQVKRPGAGTRYGAVWLLSKRFAAGLVALLALGPATLLMAQPATAGQASAVVSSVTTNDSKYHVFTPGEPFSFTLTYVGSGVTGYQWVDWQGRNIGPSVAVTGTSFTVNSPGDMHAKPGYYGLRLLPAGTIIEPGDRKELGFAVLPKAQISVSNRLPFGMNHASLDDPYLGYKWTKTTWSVPFWAWDGKSSTGKLDSTGWQASQENVRNYGRVDLPDVIGAPWGTVPADPAGVAKMADAFFQATPNVPAWEWGIEEAHAAWDAKTATRYYQNFAVELAAVRAAADLNGAATTKLVHQIEGVYEHNPTHVTGVQVFFASSALRYVDILSLHPYAWPDFQSPDAWLDPYLKAVEKYRAASAKSDIPIWFTEVGCFTDDADLGSKKMEDGGSPVTGLSRADAAEYVIKLHAIALTDGISRIYWYHYQDWDASTANAESHFGLRDYWGYPRPGYAAYATLVADIGSKQPEGVRILPGGVHVYKFGDSRSTCYIAWAYPAPKAPLIFRISSLCGKQSVAEITDTVGRPISAKAGTVAIGKSPIFLLTGGSATNAGATLAESSRSGR